MPRRDRYVPDLPHVFVGREAVREGALTPGQLRGRTVARVLHGVYRLSSTADTHEVRCLAACLLLPPWAAVTGVSAATAMGLPLAATNDDVRIVVPEGHVVPRRRGVRVKEATRPFRVVTRPDRLRFADSHRVAFDAAAGLPLPEAVAVLDAMTRADLVNMQAFAQWLADDLGNGVRTVREAVPLVDPRAESQPESAMRVVLLRAGLPVVPQYAVVLHGRLVARVDLALPEFRLAIEYDGAWHVLREQLERDRARLNALQGAGWTVVHVTAAMLRHPDELVARVRAAVARAQRAS